MNLGLKTIFFCILSVILQSTFARDTLFTSSIQKEVRLLGAKEVSFSSASLQLDMHEIKQQNYWQPFDSLIDSQKPIFGWLHIIITNNLPKEQTLYFTNRIVDSIDFFVEKAQKLLHFNSGQYVNAKQLQIKNDISSNFFHLKENESVNIFIRLKNEHYPLPLNTFALLTSDEYSKQLALAFENQRSDAEYHSAILGALLFSAVFVALINFWFREKSFWFYFLFAFGAFLYLLTKGDSYSFLSTEVQKLAPNIFKFNDGFQYLFYASYISFAISLLSLSRYNALYQYSKMLIVLFVAYSICIVIYQLVFDVVLLPVSIFLPARIGSYLLCGVGLIWTIFTVKSPLKTIFLIGSFTFLLFTILSVVCNLYLQSNVRPFYFLPPITYFKTGVMLEALIFAIALGYKMHLVEKEKQSNYQAYINQLEVNEKLIREMNSQLEATIAERTLELEQQHQKQLRLEYEQKLTTLEMQALRSQMNPHFIFNSLNSIRYQIQSKQYKIASDYLMKFSKLLRLTLENSRRETITLEEEIQFTNLYLEIEGQRFGDQFKSSILVNEQVDCSEIEIPPMLLQPFVENAIKHGLMNSNKSHKLITITINNTNDGYTIAIEDNGIGRSASEFRKKQSGLTHHSLGLQITNERLALFSKKSGIDLHIKINDIVDSELVSGTCVLITYKLKTHA